MTEKRIIPILTIQGEDLVKTTRFANARYIGDPLNVLRIFSSKHVDEIILLDIGLKPNQEINFQLIESLAEECNMPLTYGGGIKHFGQAKQIFELGFEKILIRNGIHLNPALCHEITSVYGRQSLIGGIDLDLDAKLSQEEISDNLNRAIDSMTQKGVGEVFINDRTRDGTLSGAQQGIIVSSCSSGVLPVIWAGGFNSLADIELGFANGLSAVGVGSFFSFYGKFNSVLITYPEYGNR
jgi:cyclase